MHWKGIPLLPQGPEGEHLMKKRTLEWWMGHAVGVIGTAAFLKDLIVGSYFTAILPLGISYMGHLIIKHWGYQEVK